MNKYIFPGADASLCPSAMLKAMEKAGWETHSSRTSASTTAGRSSAGTTTGSVEQGRHPRGLRRALVPHLALLPRRGRRIIAEQGNAACFQVVLNKNLDKYDRKRWVTNKSVVLGERAWLGTPKSEELVAGAAE